MKLEGVHHITCITGDAPRNVEFYVGLLGLRLVKKSVNQDDPTIYHLFYADEEGHAGSDLTFFEYPGVGRGRAGAGMIHRIVFRIASDDALRFWEERLGTHGVAFERGDEWIRFDDPEGLTLELRIVAVPDAPLIADHTDIPKEVALQGFHGVRAYTVDPERSRPLLEEAMGFSGGPTSFELRGDKRRGFYEYDVTNERGLQAGGTVHHIAWASQIDDHIAWRQRVIDGGMNATPVIDRLYFKSVYYREPSGVLFEIATLGPGFTVDESPETLGQKLSVPPATLEKLAKELALSPDDGSVEAFLHEKLTPLPDVRQWRPSGLREPVDSP
jgi:glyoxalase family protein